MEESTRSRRFVIEDEIHAEWCGQFDTFAEALKELEARCRVPWDEKPNVAPCQSWTSCGRDYSIVEFDISESPWTEISRVYTLSISAKGICWNVDPNVLGDEQSDRNQS